LPHIHNLAPANDLEEVATEAEIRAEIESISHEEGKESTKEDVRRMEASANVDGGSTISKASGETQEGEREDSQNEQKIASNSGEKRAMKENSSNETKVIEDEEIVIVERQPRENLEVLETSDEQNRKAGASAEKKAEKYKKKQRAEENGAGMPAFSPLSESKKVR
jgi:hypothetical protein